MVLVKSGQYIDFNVNLPMFANGGIPGLVKKTCFKSGGKQANFLSEHKCTF